MNATQMKHCPPFRKVPVFLVLWFAGVTIRSEIILQRLHSFGLTAPTAPLIQASDGNLYATTPWGGDNGLGSVFQTTTGGGLATLYSFTGGNDGAAPESGIIQASDGNLYGTTRIDGAGGHGTVFRITADGNFSVIYSFTGRTDGSGANGLVQATDGNLYGTTTYAGTGGAGSVFRITTNGNFGTLYSFTGGADGGHPAAGLIQAADGGLYGTTFTGGAAGYGTVFHITVGGAFVSVYSFSGGTSGNGPSAALVQGGDGNLYGTTPSGGTSGYGTLFRLSTNGTFTLLHSFSDHSDGGFPYGALIRASDGQLYGTTLFGGSGLFGTLYRISTNGVLTTLYPFSGGADGLRPFAGLVQANDGNFYGTTVGGFNTIPATFQIVDGTLFQFSTNSGLNTLSSFATGNDSKRPNGLVQGPDGNFYGTAAGGPVPDLGGVFQLATNGMFTSLYSFTDADIWGNPHGLVQAPDGTLYGTADGGTGITPLAGIAYGDGMAFKVTTNGQFTLLYAFTGGSDGYGPSDPLLASDSNLYGTTQYGTPNLNGAVFQLSTNGSLTPLYPFSSTAGLANALVQATDGNLYGTCRLGGANSNGFIFRITGAGAFNVLYSLSSKTDGDGPLGRLVQGRDGKLYGTAHSGGTNGHGTVFSITTNGLFSTLYSFTGGLDGGGPGYDLIQASDGNLYGITVLGGASGSGSSGLGTIFQMNPTGSLTTIYSFTVSDGRGNSGLVQGSNGWLYGTDIGDPKGWGTVFRIQLLPPAAFPVALQAGPVTSGNFNLGFRSTAGQSYTLEQNTDLNTTNWIDYTNFTGDGSFFQLLVPDSHRAAFFRVRTP